MDTMSLPIGSKLSTFEVENQTPLTTLQLSNEYFNCDQGILEFTVTLCRQHDHGRRNRRAPDPSPKTVNFLFQLQVHSILGFGSMAKRLVGEMESATIKRFWDNRLPSRFRDYDRRNNGVGYFRWSDNEPSARHKHDHKRAILLEDGKGHEVVIPKSGHQPFLELEFEEVVKEIREANDWTIDDDMMGKVYEGVINILHHDKPRCCKTEKLKKSRHAASNRPTNPQNQGKSDRKTKRPLARDLDTEVDRGTIGRRKSAYKGGLLSSYRPNYSPPSGCASSPYLAPAPLEGTEIGQQSGQSKGGANPPYPPIAPPDNILIGRRPHPGGAPTSYASLHVPGKDPTIEQRTIRSCDNERSTLVSPTSAPNPSTGQGPVHSRDNEARLETHGEKTAETMEEQK